MKKKTTREDLRAEMAAKRAKQNQSTLDCDDIDLAEQEHLRFHKQISTVSPLGMILSGTAHIIMHDP